MKYISSLFIALALFCTTAQAQSWLDSIVESETVPGAYWSITILDEQGNAIASKNSNQLITPASNQKIYTLGAILKELGSDYTFKTNIYGSGKLTNGTWNGDLLIVGKGDPSISGDLYKDDRYHVFKSYLEQLNKAGISRINGNIIGHNGYFDQQVYPKGWDWDDLSFYYGVEVDALSFNNNAVDIEVFADGKVGEKPRMTVFPENIEGIELINDQVIAEGNTKYDEYYRREMGSNIINLRSSLPEGYFEEESLSIDDAPRFFIKSFTAFLEENGIEINSSQSEIEISQVELNLEEWTELAVHESKPLSDLVTWAMKESDNFYTEMLMKTLAAEQHSNPASFDEGIMMIRSSIADMKIDTNFVFMKDGSGMASGNLTTTGNLASYLHQIKEDGVYPDFYKSLSISGIDGTLKYRFKRSTVYKQFRGKSGYMSGVRTLSGYLTAKSGSEITVSIATNNFIGKVRPVDALHQQILEYLYENN